LQSEHVIPQVFRNVRFVRSRETIKAGENLLSNQKYALFIYSSVFEDPKEIFKSIRHLAIQKDSFEFIDAPIYYKDLFNNLRTKKQIYELFIVSLEKLDTPVLTSLWNIAFEPGVTVIKK
ncbi:MAG: hypothetical protein ABIL20_07580, partial [candidate division WOR-3 bacterium]